MENQFVGNYIKDPVVQEQEVSQVKSNPLFAKTIEEIKKLIDFNESNLNLAFIYQYDAIDVADDFNVNKLIVLETEDRKVNVEFFQTQKNGEVHEDFSARIIRPIGGAEFVTGLNVTEDKVEEVFEDELAQAIPALALDLPEFEEYEPGILTQSVETEATWTNSCMYWGAKYKRYEHCGKDCGVWGSMGGGKLVNRIDGCCAIHDDCYKNNRRQRFCCDKYLLSCAQRSSLDDYQSYLAIKGAFTLTAKLCRE